MRDPLAELIRLPPEGERRKQSSSTNKCTYPGTIHSRERYEWTEEHANANTPTLWTNWSSTSSENTTPNRSTNETTYIWINWRTPNPKNSHHSKKTTTVWSI